LTNTQICFNKYIITFRMYDRFRIWSDGLSRYDGLETKQKSLFLSKFMLNLCMVTVIELIVFSYNDNGEIAAR
jgi:hypothetical protein